MDANAVNERILCTHGLRLTIHFLRNVITKDQLTCNATLQVIWRTKQDVDTNSNAVLNMSETYVHVVVVSLYNTRARNIFE